MKELGKIIHYTKSKVYVIKANEKITLDTYILNSSGRVIAKVIDIIGPVSNPFVVAKPLIDNPDKYVGATVYYTKLRRRE